MLFLDSAVTHVDAGDRTVVMRQPNLTLCPVMSSSSVSENPWLQPGEALRGRVRIQFVDEHGLEEAGIDGGGLFKDFMEHLVREVGVAVLEGVGFEGVSVGDKAGPAMPGCGTCCCPASTCGSCA